jgi:phenylalanyl-tRNA synthetase alpha subunit
MAYAFDTLAFAKRLRDGGIPEREAEVHAEAAREFIMTELVTKTDLDATRRELETSIETVRRELTTSIENVRQELTTSIENVRQELTTSIANTRAELKAMIVALGDDMKAMRREFAASLDHRDARLLLRVGIMMGSMLTLGFGIMAALIKLHP